MKTLVKQTLAVSILSTMVAGTVFAAPSEAPPAFIKKVADGLIERLKADNAKLQSNPALVKSIVRQNLDPYIDSQSFTRIVMGTYATNQYSTAAQRAQFEKNFREKYNKSDNVVDGERFIGLTVEELSQCKLSLNGMERNGRFYKMTSSTVASLAMLLQYLKI